MPRCSMCSPGQSMKLRPSGVLLEGRWFLDNDVMRADKIAERIRWLIDHHLHEVAEHPQWGAWEILYRDPEDGRYWERTFPRGELQGNGPPRLQLIAPDAAARKYGLARN